jgi:hypothetical protein
MCGRDSDPGEQDASAEPALTVELLAELQAGLLDDDTAARVRARVRADPDAAQTLRGLNRVRRDVAALGAHPPDPAPAGVVARVGAALRSAAPPDPSSPAAHAARPGNTRARLAVALAGLAATAAAIGVGAAALVTTPSPAPSTPTTAQHITVTRPLAVIPLSDPQIFALLARAPDYGELTDPQRRASCLSGLGYPASAALLAAQPIELTSRPAELLVLPGTAPDTLAVLAVAPSCSSADTGLLAQRVVHRP